MDLDQIYFFTASIKDHIHLLRPDKFKQIVLDSLIHLVQNEKIKLYGFVIMPNHIHLIWKSNTMNGKEKPHASFMKFTGHQFLETLRRESPEFLEKFVSEGMNRNYQFWQRDALPIRMYNRDILAQKLLYIHNNPLQVHWALVEDPNDYYFSSCSFYEQGDTKFNWLSHYLDEI